LSRDCNPFAFVGFLFFVFFQDQEEVPC
jgi:hypothetical protein